MSIKFKCYGCVSECMIEITGKNLCEANEDFEGRGFKLPSCASVCSWEKVVSHHNKKKEKDKHTL